MTKEKSNPSDGVYYFGYGPIVHPMVRERRKIKTTEERAAILEEHRLTFNYGGVANIVPQRGFDVHGVLMKFQSEQDWRDFQRQDGGYNDATPVKVLPYDSLDSEPFLAYTMVMADFEESFLDKPLEKLPQERYLKLISAGMRIYSADEDYIEDHIMNVPYKPSRKPEEFEQFPRASNTLPKITFSSYQSMCERSNHIYFIMNHEVTRLGPHEPDNPGAVWMRESVHGQPEAALIIHKEIIEPSLPLANTVEELTPQHFAWVEDHTLYFLQQCGLTATKVYQLVSEDELESKQPSSLFQTWFCCVQSSDSTSRSNQEEQGDRPVDRRHGNRNAVTSSEFIQREIRNAQDGGYTDDETET